MAVSRIVCMQPERLFQVGPNGSIVQPENEAVNILPYVVVAPFIRIKAGSVMPPSIQTLTAATISSTGITFRFYTAPCLLYSDEGPLTGSRWADLGVNQNIKSGDTPNPLPNGRSYAVNPGGGFLGTGTGSLLIWQLTNNDGGVTQTFVADIFLLCRGL
jgi:hypothetical protein